MKSTDKIILFRKIIKFIYDGNEVGCVCDVTDRMYEAKMITSSEFLYMQKNIDASVFLDSEKETSAIIESYVNYLRRVIRRLIIAKKR